MTKQEEKQVDAFIKNVLKETTLINNNALGRTHRVGEAGAYTSVVPTFKLVKQITKLVKKLKQKSGK